MADDLLTYRIMELYDITRGGDLMHVGEIAARSMASFQEIAQRFLVLGRSGMCWDDALWQARIEFCGRQESGLHAGVKS